jgi:hypothetical protein
VVTFKTDTFAVDAFKKEVFVANEFKTDTFALSARRSETFILLAFKTRVFIISAFMNETLIVVFNVERVDHGIKVVIPF